VESSSHQLFNSVCTTLHTLRDGVEALERSELERVEQLRGHQTVDDREAVQQSFARLQQALFDIEETLATLGEATGEIGKL